MVKAGDFFGLASAEAGPPKELQINVFWLIKDHKIALNPSQS